MLLLTRARTDGLGRNLKRDRDDKDCEDSDGKDDENENAQWMASKKRRVSGYYGASSLVTVIRLSHMVVLTRDPGANDENTPLAPASRAECSTQRTYEDDESSGNRPLSPIHEHASSEEEDKKSEWIPSEMVSRLAIHQFRFTSKVR